VLILSALTILDWYDGVVRAIGVDHKKQQQYLIILAAWDINTARRAYVLVELPTDIANEMTRLLEANSNDMAVKQKAWNSFNKHSIQYLVAAMSISNNAANLITACYDRNLEVST
jgi:hypothetical protein